MEKFMLEIPGDVVEAVKLPPGELERAWQGVGLGAVWAEGAFTRQG